MKAKSHISFRSYRSSNTPKRYFTSTLYEMWMSILVLVVITLVLSLVLYLVEHNAQPDVFRNYWDALLWSSMDYLEDPGEFAQYTPITFWGRLLKVMCAIVAISIFVVPAGLVATGFTEAMAARKRKKHLEEIGDRLKKAFRRELDFQSKYRCVPRYISLGTLQARKNMTERDIIDAVDAHSTFRLRNLATAETRGTHAHDQLVVEMFPLNRPNYGVLIDRGSNVTIACPTSPSEAGIGSFAYHLALFGGFNFISREIEKDVDEPVSFYNIDNNAESSDREEYLTDLEKLSNGDNPTAAKNRWTIFIISSERPYEETFHFVSKATEKTGRKYTVIHIDQYADLFEAIEKNLKEQYQLLSETDKRYQAVTFKPMNSAVKIGGGKTTNAFTIRVASTFVTWDTRRLLVCKSMADIINSIIGDPEKFTPVKILKKKGIGFLTKSEIAAGSESVPEVKERRILGMRVPEFMQRPFRKNEDLDVDDLY